MQKPLCVILPPGLQALLMATGLVRVLAATREVLVSTDKAHLGVVPRLFSGLKVTFWFGDPDPVARANKLGLQTLVLPGDPAGMYRAAKVPQSHMHTMFDVARDKSAEKELVERVMRAHGLSFVVTWTMPGAPLDAKLLPAGVPVVEASGLGVTDPLQLCGLLEHALQVHAADGWLLTLADLLGVPSKKHCHAYASAQPASACRGKYRRRVVVYEKNLT